MVHQHPDVNLFGQDTDVDSYDGYAGQISLGHAGFYALGGYGSAIAAKVITACCWCGWAAVAMLVGALPAAG